MNYEAWRISFQDSEHAAKAAFEEAQRYKRMFNMAINSIVELTEAAGIPIENQLTGGNFQALLAIEKLKERREKWKVRALKAEKDRDDYHIAEQRQIALRRKMEEERDALSHSEGMNKAAIYIEQKANSYDEEHGKTDPSTNHREYPGDGAEYYNDLMELADELRRQANGEPGGAAWTS